MALRAIDELMDMDRPFGRLFEDFYVPMAFRRLPLFAGRPFLPAADVFTRNGDLVIKLEVPGIDPSKDVTVTIEDGALTVKGRREEESEVKEEGYYRKEASYGSFERRLPIPKGVTEADVKATYKDGVLEIVMPGAARRPEAPKARVIPVKAEKPARS